MRTVTLAMARAAAKRNRELIGGYTIRGFLKLRGELVAIRVLGVWEDGLRIEKLDGTRANRPASVGSVEALDSVAEELNAMMDRFEAQRQVAETWATEQKRLNGLAFGTLTFDQIQNGAGRERSRNIATGEYTREARR